MSNINNVDITNPYNFVPFDPNNVYYPDWANFISHDVPFADGLSGTIELEITNHSPLFIRDGALPEIKTNDNKNQPPKVHEPFKFGDKYYLPGSSIKGMLRNVLEIMSFSKMNFVNDHKYSVRDLNNRPLYMDRIAKAQVWTEEDPHPMHCGWLYKEEGKYYIENCGRPIKISYQEIDKLFKTTFFDTFIDPDFLENTSTSKVKIKYNTNNQYTKSAKYKYDEFGDLVYGKGQLFTSFKFSRKIVPPKDGVTPWEPQYTYEKSSSADAEEGILVFTGQPGHRKPKRDAKSKASGKIRDFIFPKNQNPEILEVTDEQIKTFKFAYLDHEPKQQREDWKFMSERLKNNERIPIFFIRENINSGPVVHFGLSFLYKLPYNYFVKDYLQTKHLGRFDLSQCIFGAIDEQNKNQALRNTKSSKYLKGRVHIGHAVSDNAQVLETPVRGNILASPKASYYPFYVVQPNAKQGKKPEDQDYSTYMDKNAALRGFKRYAIQKKVWENKLQQIGKNVDHENTNVSVDFIPIRNGAKFKTTISFHNLRPVELGALLSAITFHGYENQDKPTFHALGMAKPLGYGKIKFDYCKCTIGNGQDSELECDKKYYMGVFEAEMNEHLKKQKTKWNEHEAIMNLFALSVEQQKQNFQYPRLAKFNEFKLSSYCLPSYLDLPGVQSVAIDPIEADIKSSDSNDYKKYASLLAKMEDRRDEYQRYLLEYIKTAKRKITIERDQQVRMQKEEEERKLQKAQQELAEQQKISKLREERERKEQELREKPLELPEDDEEALKEINLKFNSVRVIFSDSDRKQILERLTSMYNKAGKNSKAKLKKDWTRKLPNWIGEDHAKSFLDSLD